jgi:hypothetical protein
MRHVCCFAKADFIDRYLTQFLIDFTCGSKSLGWRWNGNPSLFGEQAKTHAVRKGTWCFLGWKLMNNLWRHTPKISEARNIDATCAWGPTEMGGVAMP